MIQVMSIVGEIILARRRSDGGGLHAATNKVAPGGNEIELQESRKTAFEEQQDEVNRLHFLRDPKLNK